MTLKEYFELQGRGSVAAFADQIGCTTAYIYRLANELPSIHPKRCVEFENMTGGKVMRWDLRPYDWWLIWPELLEREDHPPITEPA